jgi:hypothetical protein
VKYAYFVPARRLFSACYEEEVQGLSLLRVELPRRRGAQRRILRRLGRMGVNWVLNLPELSSYPEHCPRLVETGELYRRRGGAVALWALERRGLAAEESVVGLRSRRWTPWLERLAVELAQRVRGLALCLEQGEEEAGRALLERCGVPVFHGEGDVTLCYAPAEPDSARLLLAGPRPRVEGLAWRWSGGEFPEGAPADALLCVLAQRGSISWEEAECGDI